MKLYGCSNILLYYQITLQMHIPRSYGWKKWIFSQKLWPLTLNFDPSPLLFYAYLLIHVNHSHQISKPLNISSQMVSEAYIKTPCPYGWKFSDLWPWENMSKINSEHLHRLLSLGQVWTKSTPGFSLNCVLIRGLGCTDRRTDPWTDGQPANICLWHCEWHPSEGYRHIIRIVFKILEKDHYSWGWLFIIIYYERRANDLN